MLTKPFKKLLMITLAASLVLAAAFTLKTTVNAIQSADTSWYNDDISEFEINSAAKLAGFSKLVNGGTSFKDKTVNLTSDIDLDIAPYNSGAGWMPIGMKASFLGTFNGNDNTISGLYINREDGYVGLFGQVTGNVFDINLLAVNIKGGTHTGGIAGWIQEGSVTNCYVFGTVKGDSCTGGIAGFVGQYGNIANCYVSGTVKGDSCTGGIAGYIGQYGNVTSCCSAAQVFSNGYAGGVAGFAGMKGKINDCYSTGNIGVDHSAGGILGGTNASGSVVENCYSTSSVTGNSYAGGIVGDIVNPADKVTNCVALNPMVFADSFAGRIAGNSVGILLNNHAYSGMCDKDGETLLWANKTCNGIDGRDIDAKDIFSADFWKDTAAFNTDVWIILNGKLPVLKNIKCAQDADLSHLQQNGVKVSVPTLFNKTKNSITVNAAILDKDNGQEVEYAISTTGEAPENGWQTELTFTDLTPETTYYIFARSKANDQYLSGEVSESLEVKTDAEILEKIDGAKASVPALASKTKNSITINAAAVNPNNGQVAEYAISTTNAAPASGWQTGLTFTGLNADTTYYIFARAKENNQYLTGAVSSSLTVKTDAETGDNNGGEEKEENEGLSCGAIAGIVVACVVVAVIAGLAVYIVIKKKKT